MALGLKAWADLLVKMPNRMRRGRRVRRNLQIIPRDWSTTVQRTAVVMVYSKSARLVRSKAHIQTVEATQALGIDGLVGVLYVFPCGVGAETDVRERSPHCAQKKYTR